MFILSRLSSVNGLALIDADDNEQKAEGVMNVGGSGTPEACPSKTIGNKSE